MAMLVQWTDHSIHDLRVEIYDARRDIPDWYLPEADAGDAWQPVVVRPIDAAPASQIADFHARHYWPPVFSRNT